MKIWNLLNWPITLSSCSLVLIGILVIYSSSKELALNQLILTVVGLLFFFVISQFDLNSLKNLINMAYYLTIILLLAVLILGIETRGSVRWIPLGIFNIQPSEFAKPVLILFLAKFWTRNLPTWKNIFRSILWTTPFFVLIFQQPDLGSSLTLIAIWIGMLIVAGVSIKKIIILTLISVCLIPTTWIFLHDYQKQRISGFLTPDKDPLGKGYNLIQSTIAVGSGQIFGRGLGRGTQSRLQFLPEFRTDFIFASIAEEMGFVGSLIILSLYLFLLVYCLKISQNSEGLFSFLIIIGVFTMLLFQIFVNVGMNLGILPITGITLPLISYGGSSLIATFLSLGLVASCAKIKRRIDTES